MDLYNKTSIKGNKVAIRGLNIAWQDQLATNNTDKKTIITFQGHLGGGETKVQKLF